MPHRNNRPLPASQLLRHCLTSQRCGLILGAVGSQKNREAGVKDYKNIYKVSQKKDTPTEDYIGSYGTVGAALNDRAIPCPILSFNTTPQNVLFLFWSHGLQMLWAI